MLNSGAYTSQRDVTKSHFCPIEMEEIHELDRPALLQRPIIDPAGLVIEFEVDWENFSKFYTTIRGVLSRHTIKNLTDICFSFERGS